MIFRLKILECKLVRLDPVVRVLHVSMSFQVYVYMFVSGYVYIYHPVLGQINNGEYKYCIAIKIYHHMQYVHNDIKLENFNYGIATFIFGQC